MKALRLISPGNLKLENNIEIPKLSSDCILLKVHYCGICSSDIKFIDDLLIANSKKLILWVSKNLRRV